MDFGDAGLVLDRMKLVGLFAGSSLVGSWSIVARGEREV
jgi:hypothetical protein